MSTGATVGTKTSQSTIKSINGGKVDSGKKKN